MVKIMKNLKIEIKVAFWGSLLYSGFVTLKRTQKDISVTSISPIYDTSYLGGGFFNNQLFTRHFA